jgi:hypoxanthine-DNA glycosylase
MGQYYAQPQNTFWKIMGALFEAGPTLPYAERTLRLRARGVAVWDVLAAGERDGSLDSAIVRSTMVVNDFARFFAAHSRIALICFNGATAAALFRRRVQPSLTLKWAAVATHVLPSTSPAHAAMRFEQKLARWSEVLGALDAPAHEPQGSRRL